MINMKKMERFRIEEMPLTEYRFPDLAGPSKFVREHMQPGDIVISNNVFQTNHLMGQLGQPSGPKDYVLMTRSYLPVTLGDSSDVIIDRRDGAPVIYTPEMLDAFLAKNPRVWYIVSLGQNYLFCPTHVSVYLRRRMRVAYEDQDALVLFSGDANRPESMMRRDELMLRSTKTNFLH
jgi:hypothetical protein